MRYRIKHPNLIFPGEGRIIPTKKRGLPTHGFSPHFPEEPEFPPGFPPMGQGPPPAPGPPPALPGPPPTVPPGRPGRTGFGFLQRGSKGPEVRILQERLTELGFYEGTFSGIFGRQTEEAVRAFQRSMGFPETGIVDDVMWAALGF